MHSGDGNMITPSAIIRTNRRSLSLTIAKDGGLIVRAPKKLSMEYIYSFIKQKEKWILNKQRAIQNSKLINNEIVNGNQFLCFGKIYIRVEIDKIKNIELVDDSILIPSSIDNSKKYALLFKWYNQLTKDIIKSRVTYFADLMQVSYSLVKIDNSKAKWGSCDNKGVIKLNLRLSMLPHKVIDYIIIHELAHLLEFNHSKNFYKIIESIMPDYKRYRAMLKEYNFVLQLLR